MKDTGLVSALGWERGGAVGRLETGRGEVGTPFQGRAASWALPENHARHSVFSRRSAPVMP
jgi:hypothetical protein